MNRSKKGFTLAELLIVVAIIAVLVAISIPIFTSQLKKARLAVDHSAIRDAYAVVQIANNLHEVEIDGTAYSFDQLDGLLGELGYLFYLSKDCSSLVAWKPDLEYYILKESGADGGESCPTCMQWDTTESIISNMHQKDCAVLVFYSSAEKKLFLGLEKP